MELKNIKPENFQGFPILTEIPDLVSIAVQIITMEETIAKLKSEKEKSALEFNRMVVEAQDTLCNKHSTEPITTRANTKNFLFRHQEMLNTGKQCRHCGKYFPN